MQHTSKKYLEFCDYSQLNFWDYYTLTHKNQLTANYPLVDLSMVLKQRKEFITIDDTREYKRCRVQVQAKGVVLRDVVLGKEIKTKKQQLCKKDDFLVAEIDAKVGGYGIVPDFLEDAIVSGHYFLFEIDKSLLLPEFLAIVVQQQQFAKQVKSTGSTNYAAIRPYHVLGYKIPLPSKDEQKAIVQAYNKKVEQAEHLFNQGNDLESEIENYFLEELGLEPYSVKEKVLGLFTVDYSMLERWDFFSGDARINTLLSKAKFTITNIGKAFSIAKRPWNKKNEKKESFKYIEIGAIDPIHGILEVKEILTSKAPSRATQIVKEGDLIIGTTRPYLKKFAIVSKEFDGDVCSSGFTVIESKEDYYLPYLLQFLRCSYGVEQLKNKMTGGLYPAITESELKEVRIPLPDVNTQMKIMQLIKKKENDIIRSKEMIDSLKQQAQQEFEKAIFN